MRRALLALTILATPAVAVVAAPVVTVSSEAPASVANARPVMDEPPYYGPGGGPVRKGKIVKCPWYNPFC